MQVILDISRMGREQLHDYLQEMLPLPEYYGRNLDALYDCLTELTDTVVVIEGEEQAGAWYKKVRRVLFDACSKNEELIIEHLE